jgi:hypothetical protein
MGVLKGLANFAGKTLKAVGTIGAAALKPVGAIAGSAVARGLANRAIDALPLPNVAKDVAKGAVEKASEFVTSGKAAAFLNKVKGTGERLQAEGGG